MIHDVSQPSDRAWVSEPVRTLEADAARSADTHLFALPIRAAGIDLYLKDESAHPTGSLKHRLARSLVLYGLVNGLIHQGTTLVEASSGSTAVSEAYFARLLGLPFIAVLPRSTSAEKVQLIEFAGGTCRFVDDPMSLYAEAAQVASDCHGHYLDQFRLAERATDWRGNNNIAESVFEQLRSERHPVPAAPARPSAGTSATSDWPPRSAWSTRRAQRSCRAGRSTIPPYSVGHPGSRGSAGRAWRSRSSPASWIGCLASLTPQALQRPGGCADLRAGLPAGAPGPT